MVRLVITSEFFGVNENYNDIRRELNSWGAKNIVFEDDGMITAVMTEIQFEEFMSKLKAKIDDYLINIEKSYSVIKTISHDNSYINFDVVGKDFTDEIYTKIAIEIRMAVAPYQIFNGIPQEETSVTVNFRNNSRGKIIKIINTLLI